MDLSLSPISVIIFILTIGLSVYTLNYNHSLYEKFVLHPYSLIRNKSWYQIITSGFIHADGIHLGFNMLTFYFFAFRLESIVGSFAFFAIYIVSMIVADLPTIYKNKDNYDYSSVGASGAIAGILFSFIIFSPQTKLSLMLLPIGIPSPIFAILYLVYCHFADRHGRDNINHSAHLYGALAGFLITIFIFPDAFMGFLKQLPYIFSSY